MTEIKPHISSKGEPHCSLEECPHFAKEGNYYGAVHGRCTFSGFLRSHVQEGSVCYLGWRLQRDEALADADKEHAKAVELADKLRAERAEVAQLEAELHSHPDREKLIADLRSEYKQALDDNHEFASMLRRERQSRETAESHARVLEGEQDVLRRATLQMAEDMIKTATHIGGMKLPIDAEELVKSYTEDVEETRNEASDGVG